jgi:hypothetical protein
MKTQQKKTPSTTVPKSPGGMLMIILLMTIIGVTGFFIGRKLSHHENQESASGSAKYILLIHNESLSAVEQQDGQNKAWLKTIGAERYSEGDQFSNNGWILSPGPNEPGIEVKDDFPGNGNVSGYFIFDAKNDDEALKIAKTCPHLNNKGFLEMRKLK